MHSTIFQSPSHIRTQDLSSIEYSDNDGEYMDEQLLLMEVRRRRERDFGQDASNSLCASCSWTEREEDYECDSLCTESELSAEVLLTNKASYTSEAEVKQEEFINTQAEGKEQGNCETYCNHIKLLLFNYSGFHFCKCYH